MTWKERSRRYAALFHRIGRALVVGVGVSAVIFSCSPSFALDSIRVGKAGEGTSAFLPVDIGVSLGIFKKHGLDVVTSSYAGGAQVQLGLAADAIDIGLGSGPDMVSIVRGSPVKAVGVMTTSPLLVPVVGAVGNVKSWHDLKGGSVAVSQGNSLSGWLVRQVSQKEGWGPNGIRLISVGDERARIAAVMTKQVNAMVVDVATGLAFQQRGDGKLIEPFNHYVKNFVGNVIFASNKIRSQHPDRVRRFLAGWYETVNWMSHHRTETVQRSESLLNIKDAIAGQVYDFVMPLFSLDGRFAPAAMTALSNSFVDIGTVRTPPDMKQLYTERYLPARGAN